MKMNTIRSRKNRFAFVVLWIGWALASSIVQASRATDIQRDLADVIEKASKAYVKVGGGSGVVVSPDGYVLTNHHVVVRRLKMDWTIEVPGRGKFKAKVLGFDSNDHGDIALLKLEGAKDLPFLELFPSDDLRVGQWVVTLGNPYTVAVDSLIPSASLGVVSALHLSNGYYDDGIQTDASINPGNSGGPLLDLRGRLVGIAGKHSVRWKIRTSTGANYAVGSSRVLRMMDRIRAGEIIYPSRLEGLGFGSETGQGTVAVQTVVPGSQAELAGFLVGDQIVRFQGNRVTSAQNLNVRVVPYSLGSSLTFDLLRNGKEMKITTALTHRLDPLSDTTVLGFVENAMRGHIHLPHPRTRQNLHLDFQRAQELVKKLGKNQVGVTLEYQEGGKQPCEVDVVVEVSPQGQHRLIRSTVGRLGDKDFRVKRTVDPKSDEGILEFVQNSLTGHQHLPHPETKEELHLDYESARETVEKLEGNQVRVVLFFLDGDKQPCEVDVVVEVGTEGPPKILRTTVGKIGETVFRR